MFLYLKFSVVCVNRIQTPVLTHRLCVSLFLPPQQMKLMEVLIVCSSGIDYSAGGENRVPSPESFFHMNYYALYFVLSIQSVPYGTLKVIWQHSGVRQQQQHTHMWSTLRKSHTHMRPLRLLQSMSAQRSTCRHAHIQAYASLIFLSSLLSFTHPSYFHSFSSLDTKVQPRVKANMWWKQRSCWIFQRAVTRNTSDLSPRGQCRWTLSLEVPPHPSPIIHQKMSCFISKHFEVLNI